MQGVCAATARGQQPGDPADGSPGGTEGSGDLLLQRPPPEALPQSASRNLHSGGDTLLVFGAFSRVSCCLCWIKCSGWIMSLEKLSKRSGSPIPTAPPPPIHSTTPTTLHSHPTTPTLSHYTPTPPPYAPTTPPRTMRHPQPSPTWQPAPPGPQGHHRGASSPPPALSQPSTLAMMGLHLLAPLPPTVGAQATHRPRIPSLSFPLQETLPSRPLPQCSPL